MDTIHGCFSMFEPALLQASLDEIYLNCTGVAFDNNRNGMDFSEGKETLELEWKKGGTEGTTS